MRTPERELGALREISPQASFHIDGGVQCLLLPRATLIIPGGQEVMDAVLCVSAFAGYTTRLLLERRIAQKPQLNWQTVTLLSRTWHTWSWNHISGDQPWIQTYAEHARVLR